MKSPALGPLRESLLIQASGDVLEIGLGTGANLSYYPSDVGSVTAIDPNPGMVPIARASPLSEQILVRWVIASAERLPFASAAFNTVVSTLTLCSISDISLAIKELHRVLKPGGQFLFLEHGLAPDHSVCWWQDKLTPYWKHIGDGCHLNRPMSDLIQSEPWQFTSISASYVPQIPKPFGYFYQGCAVKAKES